MLTMSIYQVDKFELFNEKIKESMAFQSDVTEIPDHKTSIEPITSLEMINENFYKGFSYIEVEHESERKEQIRVKHRFFNIFFVMQKKVILYNPNEKILLLLANKELAKEIIERMSAKFLEKFKLNTEQKKYDFRKITRDKNTVNTWGAWFKNVGYGNVKSMALFGDHVQLDDNYEANFDKISSLNIDFLIDENPMSVIVSKDQRIAVLSRTNEKEMIDYYYVFKNLYAE